MSGGIQYQTISEFLTNPFGKKEASIENDYKMKYDRFRSANKISMVSVLEIDDSYLIHMKVPSESEKDNFYDVVIQFFVSEDSTKTSPSLERYFIKFFSNSPSFIYRYAYLYNSFGFLIDGLKDKLGGDCLDNPPEKSNASGNMSYDKSIYFACRFLMENKFFRLTKVGLLLKKTTNAKRFFENISDFETIKTASEVSKLEKSVEKSIERDKKEAQTAREKSPSRGTRGHEGVVEKNNGKPKIGVMPKKGAGGTVGKKSKITASRNTTKKK